METDVKIQVNSKPVRSFHEETIALACFVCFSRNCLSRKLRTARGKLEMWSFLGLPLKWPAHRGDHLSGTSWAGTRS